MSEGNGDDPDDSESYVPLKEIQSMLIERLLAEMYINLGWSDDNALELIGRLSLIDRPQQDS